MSCWVSKLVSMKALYLVNTQEDILVIHCSPQSVFRMRPATHCSPMLSSEPALPLVSSLKCTHIPRPGHASPILCTSFSPTGKLLATRSGDNNVWLWDLVLSGHKNWVLCVEWGAWERKLATGGHDGHVQLLIFFILYLGHTDTDYQRIRTTLGP